MNITIDHFFELFLAELRENDSMQEYYKFLVEDGRFFFRKNYFMRRLEFVSRNAGPPGNNIWDCGCGYGTTALFFALNGHNIRGTTLEFYYEQIEKRLAYWSRIGSVRSIRFEYNDIFDEDDRTYDRIIVQDTLHHLEPIDQALTILRKKLTPGGRLICVEENGRNLFQRTKDFMLRGNKRIKEIYDERLGRSFLLGNENIRPYNRWKELLAKAGFTIEDHEFIRLFLPRSWKKENWAELQEKEKTIWLRNPIAREYLYWGVNFVASPVEASSSGMESALSPPYPSQLHR